MKNLLVLFLLIHSQSIKAANFASFMDVINHAGDFFEHYYQYVKTKLIHLFQNQEWNRIQNKGNMVYTKTVHNFNSLISNILKKEEMDPDFIKLKSEPTATLTTEELVELHGERVKQHEVETKDGYVLRIFQMVLSKSVAALNRTVLLYHGLLGSSADWVMLGPKFSLPYMLQDAGYDVWMTNSRGNRYSRARNNMKADKFWNFTFQEMGKYDLRAVIDYINLHKNNTVKIDFIGHSMGASAFLVLLSTFPAYNLYIRSGVLLAPLAFMANIKGPMKLLTEVDVSPKIVTEVLGAGEFYPKRIPNKIAKQYCEGPIIFCRNPLFFMAGVLQSTSLNDLSYVARLNYHVPAGGSTKTILHYAQMSLTGRFHEFNKPKKEFLLNKVAVPIAIFSSEKDWLSTTADAIKLYVNVKNPLLHVIFSRENISHTEFVWGSLAPRLVFKKVLEVLKLEVTKEINEFNEVAHINMKDLL